MTSNYEIIFQIEAHCARELNANNQLNDADVEFIIRAAVHLHEHGSDVAIHEVPRPIELALHLSSTLYIVKMASNHRAVISVDADELFDCLVVTLWSYTTHHELHRELDALIQALYSRYLSSRSQVQGR